MKTKLELDCPADPNIKFEIEAKSDGLYFTKVHYSRDTATVNDITTVETVTITRTLGNSIVF